MIEDLLTNYVFEKLDKQIVNKVPFCLFISILLYLLLYPFAYVQSILVIATPILFLMFLISSIYFNKEVSQLANKMWSRIDVKKVLGRMTDIYENGDSYLKDIKLSENHSLRNFGFLSGVTLTLTLIVVFLQLVFFIPLENKLVMIPIEAIVGIFLLYDIAKSELIEEPEQEGSMTVVNDIMATYLVENSSRQLTNDYRLSKILFTLTTRLISPLIYFNFPKMTFKEMFVYRNPKLIEFLKQLNQGRGDLQVRQTDGDSLANVLVTDKDCDKLSDIAEKENSIVFPYLLNPEYKFTDSHKKWTSLQVIRRHDNNRNKQTTLQTKDEKAGIANEEPVGQIYIHAFRIPRVRVDRGSGRPKEIEPQRDVLMLMMMGERSPILYLHTKITAMALPCPVQRAIDEMLEEERRKK